MVTLLRPRERPEGEVPEPGDEDLSLLSGTTLSELIDAEFEATEASLAASSCPNVRVEIDAVEARSVGELLYSMEAACVLAGELYGVETFTQPAVEWGKKAARGLLGEENEESAAVAGKTELRVE
jgi:glucose-6-phosphate isomerase